MNQETRLRSNWIFCAAILLLSVAGLQVRAQDPTVQNPINPAQAQAQTSQTPDFAQLNLSPDQIQKIRAINAELKDQRQAAGMKLRQAQRALAEAVESPTPNETLIDQRSHELADAQAATIRLRSLAESRILQVMTPEQRIRLREMRQQNQALRRQANQQQLPGRVLRQRRQGLQRNANVAPAQPGQRKLQRQAPER
ncbi:MAG: Heavy-metal resistance [Blastocatellia bacterium]|jgi:Spy/CpxP family protein refolding chaperone|nr:Heavy-metal resistance [Blastocatellia bacterium]MDX6304149.1 Heavy-metal resistance [Blastocatellia bacterium]